MNYKIVTPCREDWNKMKPVEGGKFCDHCCKKVLDLSAGQKPPEGKVGFCGRIVKPRKISFLRNLIISDPIRYTLILLVLLANSIKAQVQKLAARNMGLNKGIIDTAGRTFVLSGTIIDSTTQEPVAYARGLVFDSQKKVIAGLNTDINGKFEFTFFHRTGTDTSVSLEVTHNGYIPLELNDIPLIKKNTAVRVTLDTLNRSVGTSYALGGVVATVQSAETGTVLLEVMEENIDPEKFGKLHGVPRGLKTRMDNAHDNR